MKNLILIFSSNMKRIMLCALFLTSYHLPLWSQTILCGNPAADSDAVNNVYVGGNLQGVQNVMLDIDHSHPFWCDTTGGSGSGFVATPYYVFTHGGGSLSGSGTSGYLPIWTGTSTLGKSVIQSDGYNNGISMTPGHKLDVFIGKNNDGIYGYDSTSANPIFSLFNSGQIGYIRLMAFGGVGAYIDGEGVGDINNQLIVGDAVGTGDNLKIYGNILMETAGNVLKIKSGTNASTGADSLSSGADTVHTTVVQSASEVFVTLTSDSAGTQALYVPTISSGSYFIVKSSVPTSHDKFNWFIINQP